jgi:diguanylate cyclase (GGDEF)-like protein
MLRTQMDGHSLSVDVLYARYLALVDELTTAQRRAAVAAGAEQVPVATLAAMRDVQLVADLATAANRHIPDFAGAQLSWAQAAGYRQAARRDWQDYIDAQRQLDGLSQAALREQWQRVRTSPAVTAVDDVLAAHTGGATGTRLALPQVISLVLQTTGRDTALTGFLDTAVHAAQGLAAADRARATDQRNRILALGIVLLLVSAAGALLVGRSVARALGLLATRAAQVSQGQLVDVESVGPREARTVSAALTAAVAGLRRIQDQARAVARGQLSDPVLADPLPGPLGQLIHASVEQLVTAVREREELQSALAHRAAHDPLTELPNRAQALTLLTAALHRGRRSGALTGLLFVDLDGFKAVNDGHGHAYGDAVLREVARRLRSGLRPGDEVCRLGGDEFVVLVEHAGTERDLLELAERLIGSVSEPISAAGHQVRVGASVGIAVCQDGGIDADALIAEADTAAYRAKSRGRGRAELFDESLRQQLTARAELEAAIATGLAEGEMQLHYQPVMDVGTERLTGYEALIRWERPGIGLVPPDQFIPVAEGSRLICDVDRWVLHEATRQLAEWRAAGPAAPGEPEPTIAVNISGRHLADRRVLEDVADALAASGLPPELLVVEVTETVLITDPAAFSNLAALRAMGVAIAIDDFGTGYTSIGQLGTMPVNTLKIDRSFITSTEPGHPELVALIIRAAHTFGLTVVAEGVEETEQMDWLRAQMCDHAQGYLLSRPLPAADAAALRRPSPAAMH